MCNHANAGANKLLFHNADKGRECKDDQNKLSLGEEKSTMGLGKSEDVHMHDPIVAKQSWDKLFTKKQPPRCDAHGEPAKRLVTKKKGPNFKREFWICSRYILTQIKLYLNEVMRWLVTELKEERANGISLCTGLSDRRENRRALVLGQSGNVISSCGAVTGAIHHREDHPSFYLPLLVAAMLA